MGSRLRAEEHQNPDVFHVMKVFNNVVDEVKKRIKGLMRIVRIKYTVLKRPHNFSDKNVERFAVISKRNKELAEAFSVNEDLCQRYKCPDLRSAELELA